MDYGRLLNNSHRVVSGVSLDSTTPGQVLAGRRSDRVPRVLVNMDNWTRWTLVDARAEASCGYIDEEYPAVKVHPGTREVMMAYKQVDINIYKDKL